MTSHGHDPFDRKLHVDGPDDWTLTRSELDENRQGGTGTAKFPRTAQSFLLASESLDDSWRERAICKGRSTSMFFPEGEQRGHSADPMAIAVAKFYCAACPVRKECLDFALATHQLGIWGGTTEAERQKIRRQRARGAA